MLPLPPATEWPPPVQIWTSLPPFSGAGSACAQQSRGQASRIRAARERNRMVKVAIRGHELPRGERSQYRKRQATDKPGGQTLVGQFDFHSSIEKTRTPAQTTTSQKAKRLNNGSRLSANTSSYLAPTSSPPRLHHAILSPEALLVRRTLMMISPKIFKSATTPKLRRKHQT